MVSGRFAPTGEVTASRRGAFSVGTEPVPGPLGTVMGGPRFVEWEAPADPSPGPPWVLVHGGGGQATDYITTPDRHPTAHLHTRWPGGRKVGDPVYDQSLCSLRQAPEDGSGHELGPGERADHP